jgi:predicted O-methyltransferase YrrM
MTRNNNQDEMISNVLKKIEVISRRESLPSIGPIKRKIVEDIIKKYKPKKILEIGTLYGYSAILMANVLIKIYPRIRKVINQNNAIGSKLGNNTVVITIDINEKHRDIAALNIRDAGLSHVIEVINGDALEVIPTLDSKFDLIFLDAIKSDYLKYLKLVESNKLVNQGYVVLADNVLIYDDEMTDFLDYVRHSGKFKSRTTQTTLEFTKHVKDALEVSASVSPNSK